MSLKCTMILGDCLDVMPELPKASAQMCFADLPYGLIAQKWDSPITLNDFWPKIGATCTVDAIKTFSATQPFANSLINSNVKQFRYDLVWNKNRSSNFFQAKYRPMRTHENILVFGSPKAIYNPQMTQGDTCAGRKTTGRLGASHYGIQHITGGMRGRTDNLRYPISIIFAPHTLSSKGIHPTQKPVNLLSWLIRTYSNEGHTILDPVSGSGTTAVSALQNGRHVTCIEKDSGYFEASLERVRKHVRDNSIDAVIEERR